MPTAHVRLKPIEWFQEIGHYPKEGGEGRYLRATCTYSDDSNVRLSTGAMLSAFLADLSIMDEEPQTADAKPLEHGIGLLVFKHDRPEIAAYTQDGSRCGERTTMPCGIRCTMVLMPGATSICG